MSGQDDGQSTAVDSCHLSDVHENLQHLLDAEVNVLRIEDIIAKITTHAELDHETERVGVSSHYPVHDDDPGMRSESRDKWTL